MFIVAVVLVWLGMLGGIHPPAHLPTRPSAQSRIFLLDGRVLLTHGECARLPDELVCVVKLGGGEVAESFDLLTIPRAQVDEPRTTAYAQSVRAAHFGATRGEQEFAALTTDLTRVLAEIEKSDDRDRRLGIALMARVRLSNWSNDHFGYRAADTQRLVSMLDEVIAELRIAAGQSSFSLDFVASTAPAPPVPLLPAPSVSQSIEAALTAASLTPLAAERLALLRSAHRFALAASVDPRLRDRVAAALRREEAIERQYRTLFDDAITEADEAVRRGRPSDVERVIRAVAARDRQLGTHRPREIAAFTRRLDAELAQATAQQAAFARWAEVKSQLLAYERRLRPVLDAWVSQRPVLDTLREGQAPRRPALDRAARRFAMMESALTALHPTRELREVHALFRNAVQMARLGLSLGERLTVARNPDVAGNAASAIAGAELLLSQARTDLVPALYPRKVR